MILQLSEYSDGVLERRNVLEVATVINGLTSIKHKINECITCRHVGVDESLLWYQPIETGQVVLLTAAIGGPSPMLLVGPTAKKIDANCCSLVELLMAQWLDGCPRDCKQVNFDHCTGRI